MRRIGAIFIAVCMMLIAASIGAVLYLGFKIDASTSAIVALAALTAHGALQQHQQPPARSRRSRRPDRRSVARHRRPVRARWPRSRAASMRSSSSSRRRSIGAWRLRSARRRNRRARRAGEADRRDRRRPCRCAAEARRVGRASGRQRAGARACSPGRQPLPRLARKIRLVERFRGLSRESLGGLAFEGGHRQPCRSVPAADRDFAAAQGAVLRGGVAPAHRYRRRHSGRRFCRCRRKRRPDAEDRQSCWCSVACRWCAVCC